MKEIVGGSERPITNGGAGDPAAHAAPSCSGSDAADSATGSTSSGSANRATAVCRSHSGGRATCNFAAQSQAAFEASRNHVTLKLECETASEARWLIGLLQGTIALVTVLLIVQLNLKFHLDETEWFRSRDFTIFNIILASICLAAMGTVAFFYLQHVWRARKLVWSQRRRRLAGSYFAMLLIQMLNVTFWLVPNAYLRSTQCAWYSSLINTSGFIRWTCWNSLFCIMTVMAHCSCPRISWFTSRSKTLQLEQDASDVEQAEGAEQCEKVEAAMNPLDTFAGQDLLVLDLSLWHWQHWPPVLVWLGLEGDLIWQRTASTHQLPHPDDPDCNSYVVECYSGHAIDTQTRIATRLIASLLSIYAILTLFYFCKAFRALKRAPYHLFRVGNMIARLQRRTTGVSSGFLYCATLVLWFVQDQRCSSYLQTWLGLVPCQLVMSTLVIVLAVFFMPRSAADPQPLLKVLLQDVAWGEASREQKREARLHVASQYADITECRQAPLFCAETALKAFHWSFLSYRYEEHAGADAEAAVTPEDPDALKGSIPLDARMEAALRLFDLDTVEIMREKTHDTKMLLGSGPAAIVLSFRGTSSAAAAWADLQILLARHPRQPEVRSGMWRASVHKGFLHAWMAGGFRQRVLARVRELLAARGKGPPLRVLLTGHSLGGALATLAAYDLQSELSSQQRQVDIEVYTYGSPRVGNSAFAEAYNQLVSNTWHVINDKDTITQVGKFRVFKRTGKQVIINGLGDLIVRPAPLEQRLHFMSPWWSFGAGRRLKHHFLSEYGFSLMVVLAAQFTPKGIAGGAQGVVVMLQESEPVRELLESGGFVLGEVLRDSGYALEADGQLVPAAAEGLKDCTSQDALVNIYSLGARKWRRNSKNSEPCRYTAPFTRQKRLQAASASTE